MKIVSIYLFVGYAMLNLSFGQHPIQNAVTTFCNDPVFSHASIGIKIVDIETNQVIASHNPDISLPSASTAKLFSTATALEILGPNFQPKTRLYIDGHVDSSGTLNGNIWIRGGGDPSLGSKYITDTKYKRFFFHAWAEAVQLLGIKKISGSIIADASEFGYEGVPDGWSWSDLGNYYGAGPSGLSIFDNLINVKFNTPSKAGSPVEVSSMEPTLPNLEFFNYIKSSYTKGDNVYFYGGPYSNVRYASGTLPINQNDFLVKASIPDPELLFAYEFEQLLEANNIEVLSGYNSARLLHISSSSTAYDSRNLIYSHKGEQLIDIINYTNMKSINLFAEHMLTLIGYEKTGYGTTNSGLEIMEHYWESKFDTKGLFLHDGSGLSRSNAISATHFTELLIQMSKSQYSDQYKASLPISGVSGTLKYICKGQAAQHKIHAKSGTMSRIKSYAGYADSNSGKKYAFALIVNNQTCSSRVLKQKIAALFNVMAVN
ncbi:MAG: D-alanyl-D-alanine carboxypeptidase/D-alanyl-D-alanine-endopeptidase [Crocinitomicaceae bacterium]|nr:D-alanyl-D-alanine carboxypeptidase/D-alanyl-D-alanine-endopeptidase [Crocinitomicaceae bacterium]MDG1776552.1 D-alanyl-D-alanine carboxypeptidase/D-alanyl-D-alanine-endopeptidase [Crocinitomicaceae bacterium]